MKQTLWDMHTRRRKLKHERVVCYAIYERRIAKSIKKCINSLPDTQLPLHPQRVAKHLNAAKI